MKSVEGELNVKHVGNTTPLNFFFFFKPDMAAPIYRDTTRENIVYIYA